MSQVLTVGSSIMCSHGAKLKVTGESKLAVGGKGVLTLTGVQGASVINCPAPTSTTSKPCVSCQSVTGGLATKLAVGGAFVLVEDGFVAITDGLPTAVTASAAQTQLATI